VRPQGGRRAPRGVAARVPRVEDDGLAAERPLFLDTETTGLAGGPGTYAFLVGAGWIEGDAFVVTQHFMRDLDEEPALLAALAPLLERAGGVVTFNGSGFDLPLLETRFVLARRRWPATLPHLDLLRPSRRVWTGCLDDCRLGTLERDVLGLSREEDVPGAVIPSLYFDWLRRRRAGYGTPRGSASCSIPGRGRSSRSSTSTARVILPPHAPSSPTPSTSRAPPAPPSVCSMPSRIASRESSGA